MPEVPIPAQSDLQLRLSGFATPEILTEVSATFPAKKPNNPKSISLGFSNFILIVVDDSVFSFLRSEYGLLPVSALANAENALSLFVFKFPREFA